MIKKGGYIMHDTYRKLFEVIYTWIYEHRMILIAYVILAKIFGLSEEE